MNISTLRFLAAPAAVLALTVAASACGDDSDDGGSDGGSVTVTEVWVREPAEGQPNSAAYGVISNDSGDEITLVGASAPVSATIELHETTMGEDGTMSMSEREGGFAIPDGESFALEPGGPHVMMLDIDPAEFTEGFDVTFEFDGAESVTAAAELRALDAMDGTDMDDDMDDEGHDGTDMDDDMDDEGHDGTDMDDDMDDEG